MDIIEAVGIHFVLHFFVNYVENYVEKKSFEFRNSRKYLQTFFGRYFIKCVNLVNFEHQNVIFQLIRSCRDINVDDTKKESCHMWLGS